MPTGRPARARRLPVVLRLVLPVVLPVVLLGAAGWLLTRGRSRPSRAPGPLPGRPRLVPVVGGSVPHAAAAEPEEVLLREGRQVLGRARDADVHLRDLSVSPRHALVEADRAGRVLVRDLGALNGVQVDGIPVAQVELHDGNRLQLGDVQLVYRTDPVRDGGGRSGGELGEQVGG